jgi:hypothetical protein
MGSSKTTTKTGSTQTPVVSEPYKTDFANYTGQIGEFLDTDPTQYVAPPSSLQMQAFGDASGLGGWEQYLNQAQTLASGAAAAPTTQVSATGYQAPTVPDANLYGGTQLGAASTYGGTQLAPATTYGGAQLAPATTFGGAQLNPATQTQAAQVGSATGYSLPQLGQASQVGSTGYNAALADPSQYALGDPSRISQFMGDYQNPYTSQVIDATLADFDEYAGTQRAAQDAQAGLTGAFGGSRYGIMEGQLEGELSRGRASTQAALLDQQYRLAAQLGQYDAGSANQFALERAGMGLNTALANQQSLNQAGQYNATNALQSALSNQQANNQFSLTNFGAGVDQARYGADAANQFNLTQSGYDQQANLANQDASNQFSLQQGMLDQQTGAMNMDALNQYGLQQGALDQQAGLAGMDAMNNFALQQGLLDQQTGTLNMEAMNQFAIQQGLMDQQTGQYNTDALNNFLMTQVGLDADSAKYYADALNQASFQNANLTEQSYLRDLQASGQLGDLSQLYSTQSLADLGMTADLGSLQRSLESEYLNAYPTQLQMAGSLYGGLAPSIYSGATMTGTNTSKESGGLLGPIIGSGLQAAASLPWSPISFSDERLKTNIVRIGEWDERGDGLGKYEWNWKSDPKGPKVTGVIASEVKTLRPHAYIDNFRDGYAGVNYAKLGETEHA